MSVRPARRIAITGSRPIAGRPRVALDADMIAANTSCQWLGLYRRATVVKRTWRFHTEP